MPSEHN